MAYIQFAFKCWCHHFHNTNQKVAHQLSCAKNGPLIINFLKSFCMPCCSFLINSHGGGLKDVQDSNTNHPYLLVADTVDDLDEHSKNKMFPAYQDGPLQIGVDTAEHELAHDGGDGGKHQRATQDPSG